MLFGLLQIFFNVLVPVFLLLATGYFATRRLGLEARTLSRASYFILTPAFVFLTISSNKIEAALATRMIGYINAVYLLSTLIAFVIARLTRRSPQMTAAYMMIATFGNVGNFGLPISQFAQGQAALAPAAIYFLGNLVPAFVICVWLANAQHGNVLRSLLQVLRTPALLALPPAILVNLLQISLPPLVTRPIELLSNACIPMLLLTLGAQLATAGIPRIDRDMVVASAIRLISGALLAFAFVNVFSLSGIERNVGIIQAAMPPAVLISLIALENKLLPEFITPTVLLANVASIVPLAIVLALI
jgi:predicted permease